MKVSKSDLKSFLTQDHTSFSVLSVSTKHIESTDRISVTLSKNSARSFYLGKELKPTQSPPTPKTKPDDCLQDAQNCVYFQFFNSKQKKLYTRFKDKVEANFEVESRSPGHKTISSYLAKYLSKSFHLRSLYAKHGLKDNHKTYRFFKNLYEYEQKVAILNAGKKIAAENFLPLPKNQKIFRHYDYSTGQTSYYYRTNEKFSGTAAKPLLLKKNYRLGTRSLNPLSLLSLAAKHSKKELYTFKKPKQQLSQDFQEFLITRLLLLCKKAEFLHTPLEQEQVPKEIAQCNQSIYAHFQVKPVLHFSFLPEQALTVRQFIDKLDTYAQEFDLEESQDFNSYPITHNQKHQITQQLNGLCGCEIRARNQYLDNWNMNYYSKFYQGRTPI
ncbi:3661_t:CDS:2 [Funneliformis caledonium]|uniref:3661_t:CDS:1 n=1 Tax=Funneliformis caledonium TaxID=1117310 RepID=A0A9N9GSG4_9GLOM|nr:3661_t:CDS:2 [Funneliformis caledonium]